MTTSSTTAPSPTLPWMRLGTALFLDSMGRLDDADLALPTSLPGWTRAHVLGHVGFNAQALRRLVHWARTGERTPMYASTEQRAAEIEDGATWDGARLRDLVTSSAAELSADLDRLDDETWRAEVVTAQGRTVPASQIPWMRTREVAVHAVDLGAGADFSDLPADLCEAIVDDVVARRSTARKDGPLTLSGSGGRVWHIAGPENAPSPVLVHGSPADLARWLTGRGDQGLRAEAPALPALTPWL